MIPKIIHLCWLSGDAYPESIQRCLDSWKKHLPDYEIMLWDTKRFDLDGCLWVKQAFETKKYAFAADYIRVYALYHFGGIYLDSDVMVYKSFNDLLDLPYFIGEDYAHCFEAAIIGAEKGSRFIKTVLDRYDNRSFIKPDGSYEMKTMPIVFKEQLEPTYRFRLITDKSQFQSCDDVINVFSKDYFNSRDYIGAVQYPKSYCSHNFVGSWYKKSGTFKDSLKKIVPRPLGNAFYWLQYKLLYNRQIRWKQIPYDK